VVLSAAASWRSVAESGWPGKFSRYASYRGSSRARLATWLMLSRCSAVGAVSLR
jgi:hypothetical protein